MIGEQDRVKGLGCRRKRLRAKKPLLKHVSCLSYVMFAVCLVCGFVLFVASSVCYLIALELAIRE